MDLLAAEMVERYRSTAMHARGLGLAAAERAFRSRQTQGETEAILEMKASRENRVEALEWFRLASIADEMADYLHRPEPKPPFTHDPGS